MAWFRKTKKPKPVRSERPQSKVPEGLWLKCNGCKEVVYSRDLEENLRVCYKCGFHFRIGANRRIRMLLDGDFEELDAGISPGDPLQFTDTKRYKDRLKVYQKKADERDALIAVEGTLEGISVVMAVMNYDFMGGSMGSVVGEKITRAAERALATEQPLIIVSASGGARMQEGVLSLMQMAKVSAALHRLREAGLPYLSILTDPTTGGVTASFAMLGDLNLAEPGALIGFAGPRVIEQTIRQSLPEGFQRSEFLLEHGFLDAVVPRPELKATVGRALKHFS
ncbi:MAG: acetyl-CoA carboxylase, carboxyltransferase subunit beta [Acidobacteriota bacterium]